MRLDRRARQARLAGQDSQLFEKGEAKGIRADQLEKNENILFVLSRARKPEDADLPGFHLHPLKGDMKGLWAVTVRANWCLTPGCLAWPRL
ncbi:MAG: type II toxin-antitoxin system RelE/ParE family toxin [Nitrospirota bacterium]